jgi:hypothetical protein
MDSDRGICCEPLCLVVEDLDGSFAVCDGRSGELLARRGGLGSAAAAASLLNGRYPVGAVPPAPDTLAYELSQEPRSGRDQSLPSTGPDVVPASPTPCGGGPTP